MYSNKISAWKNRENLFSSGLTVHRTNAKMFYNLGNFYFKDDQFYEAKVRIGRFQTLFRKSVKFWNFEKMFGAS